MKTKSNHLVTEYKPNIFSPRHDQIGVFAGIPMLYIWDWQDKQFIVYNIPIDENVVAVAVAEVLWLQQL